MQTREQLRALVVEDEPAIAAYLAGMLERMGLSVSVAGTYHEAHTAVSYLPDFAVAFVDLGLPDRSGLELMSELRRLKPSMPIVVETGYANAIERDADSSGAPIVALRKPFDRRGVVSALIKVGVLEGPGDAPGDSMRADA